MLATTTTITTGHVERKIDIFREIEETREAKSKDESVEERVVEGKYLADVKQSSASRGGVSCIGMKLISTLHELHDGRARRVSWKYFSGSIAFELTCIT